MTDILDTLRRIGKLKNGDPLPEDWGTNNWDTACSKMANDAADEIELLREPFRAVDSQDWDYLNSLIPDGGRGLFWKEVFGKIRNAIDR